MSAATAATACAIRKTRFPPCRRRRTGATAVEIDVVLTADGELIVLHDLTLDRTTDGCGFAADLTLAKVRSLDAGSAVHPRFAGTKVPILAEVLEWAKREEMGLVLEIKEAERPDLAVDRMAALLDATGASLRVMALSFDHVVLKRAVARHPGLRTEAITHARHADLVGVLQACGATSVSIELRHVPSGRRAGPALMPACPTGCICRGRKRSQSHGAAGAISSRALSNGSPRASSTRSPAMTSRSSPGSSNAQASRVGHDEPVPRRTRSPPRGCRGGRSRGRPARRRAIRPAKTSLHRLVCPLESGPP